MGPELYLLTKLNIATVTVCFPSALKVPLLLRLDSAGGYGWWEEVYVPEKPARCRVPQCRQAQRHTERREISCGRVACKQKGQRMFPPTPLTPPQCFAASFLSLQLYLHTWKFKVTAV